MLPQESDSLVRLMRYELCVMECLKPLHKRLLEVRSNRRRAGRDSLKVAYGLNPRLNYGKVY